MPSDWQGPPTVTRTATLRHWPDHRPQRAHGLDWRLFPGTISADAVEHIQLSRHITEARCAHSGCADPCASRRALARSIHKSCHGR